MNGLASLGLQAPRFRSLRPGKVGSLSDRS